MGNAYISPGGPEMMRGIPHVEFIGHCITFGIAVSVNSFWTGEGDLKDFSTNILHTKCHIILLFNT